MNKKICRKWNEKMCATIIKKRVVEVIIRDSQRIPIHYIKKKKAPQTKKIQLEKQMSYIQNPHTCECVCVGAGTHTCDRKKQTKHCLTHPHTLIRGHLVHNKRNSIYFNQVCFGLLLSVYLTY